MEDHEQALGRCYLYADDYASLHPSLAHAIQDAEGTGDVAAQSTAWSLMGMWHHYQAIAHDPAERARLDVTDEQKCFEHALELAGVHGANAVPRARALFGLGLIHQVLRSDLHAAAPFFAEAHALLDRAGDQSSLLYSEVVRHVGFDTHLRANDTQAGIEWLQTSLRVREGLSEPGWQVSGHSAISFICRAVGDHGRALAHAESAAGLAHDLGLAPAHRRAAQRLLDQAHSTQASAPSAS